MATQISHPHIEKPGGEPARLIRLPRIRVTQIVIDHINHGWSADEIVIHYPHLKLAEVHSALAYYFDNQEEIDVEIAEEQKSINESRQNSPLTAVELRLRKEGLLAI